MSEKKCDCGMPLDENTACSCEPSVCVHCCTCAPDCECDCRSKR